MTTATGESKQSNGGHASRNGFVPPLAQAATFLKQFLSREDVLCFDAEWGSPCPVRVAPGKLEDALRAHVHGKKAARVIAGSWTTKDGKDCSPHPHCRLGAYFPGRDDKVTAAVTDCDGGAGHASPLTDPLGTAVEIQAVLRAYSIPSYLERSRSLSGWHNWIFFAERVESALVRRVLLCLLSGLECKVKGGGLVAVGQDGGPEIFPKADRLGPDPNAVGNPVWLPFYHGSKPGGGLFYRVDDGEADPFLPESFERVSLATLQQLDPLRGETDFKDAKRFQDPSPFLDFNRRGWPWSQLLPDWKETSPGRWRRPGKEGGISATTGFIRGMDGSERLYCFSTSTRLQSEKSYSKADVYSHLFHNGDWSATGAALRKQGYGGGKGDSPPEPWGDILPLGEVPTTLPFPVHVLPEKAARIVKQVAYAVNVPEDVTGISLLTMAGAAVGNGRRLKINETHVQHAALYSVVTMRPGERKTAAQSFLRKPFDALEREWRHSFDSRVEARKKAKDKDGEPPLLRRCWVSDSTVETLVFRLRENPQGLLQFRDEMSGLICGMNQYKGGKGNDRQAYMELWNGDRYVCDRKSQDAYAPLAVEQPFFALLGCLQPDTLPLLRGKADRQANDGFPDRFLVVYPEPLPAVGDDPDRNVLPQVRDDWHYIVRRLFTLGISSNSESDPTKFEHAEPIHFDGGARDEWQAYTWRLAHELNNPDIPDNPELRGVWSKLVGYGARIALIVQLLRWACGEAQCDRVDATSMQASADIVEWLKSHARKVLHAAGCDDRVLRARAILTAISGYIESEKYTFKRWDLHRRVKSKSKFPTPADLDSPLELLEQLNYVRREVVQRTAFVGRPPEPTWHIHPALKSHLDNLENLKNAHCAGGES